MYNLTTRRKYAPGTRVEGIAYRANGTSLPVGMGTVISVWDSVKIHWDHPEAVDSDVLNLDRLKIIPFSDIEITKFARSLSWTAAEALSAVARGGLVSYESIRRTGGTRHQGDYRLFPQSAVDAISRYTYSQLSESMLTRTYTLNPLGYQVLGRFLELYSDNLAQIIQQNIEKANS